MSSYFATREELREAGFEMMDGFVLKAHPSSLLYCFGDPKKVSDLTEEELKELNFTWSDEDNVFLFVWNSGIYLTPYEELILKNLPLGFSFREIGISLPQKSESSSWLEEWDEILTEMDYQKDQVIRKAIGKWCEHEGIKAIEPKLLAHCLKVPNCGMVISSTAAGSKAVGARTEGYLCQSEGGNIRFFPYVNGMRRGEPQTQAGRYSFRDGITLFVNVDGNTYLTPDPAVLHALREAGFTRATGRYVPLSNGEVIEDKEIRRIWTMLMIQFRPEYPHDYRRDANNDYYHNSRYYPEISL